MWAFLLTRKDGTALGEITNAFEREAKFGLSRADTAGFKLRPDHPLIEAIFDEDTMLQIYQDDTLRFWGDVLTAQFASTEDGTVPLVACTAVSPWWRASKRLVGIPAIGEVWTEGNDSIATIGTAFTSKAKARIVAEMLATTNATKETGIETDSAASYDEVGSLGNYTTGALKKLTDAWNDLANGFDGFEWRLEPLNAYPKIAHFTAANNLGATQLDVSFDFGVNTNNVRNMTYLRDITNLTNDAYIMPEALEHVGIFFTFNGKHQSDTASQSEHGLMQELVETSGIIDPTLQQSLVDEVVLVKKRPRFVAAMTLDFADEGKRVPVYGTDYNLGDIVQAHAVTYGVQLFSGRVRVYGVELKLDNNGQEAVTPVLINEGEGE